MISLLSFGISEYPYSELDTLASPIDESLAVYNCFQNHFNEQFQHYNSIVITNIDGDSFTKLINSSTYFLSNDDIQVIYFSGHAKLDDDKFHLLFNNYDPKNTGQGIISQFQISALLKDRQSKTLLILDCCFSGKAIDLSTTEYLYKKSKISVWSSTNKFLPSDANKNLSGFTQSICDAIRIIGSSSESKISLYNLFSIQKKLGYLEAQISFPEGEPDLLLTEKLKKSNFPSTLPSDFLNRCFKENIHIREMMWYSLIKEPEDIKLNILNCFFDDGYTEGSWIVRRAIGTLLSSIHEENAYKKRLILKYITESLDWKNHCIGLIGGRYSLQNDDIKDIYIKYLQSPDKPMDSVWLAHLYLSDNNIFEFGNKQLLATDWGTIDCFDRYRANKKKESLNGLYDQLKSILPEKFLLSLFYHLHFIDDSFVIPNNIEVPEVLQKSYLIKELYNQKQRGVLKNLTSKWLYSVVYGFWRDQIYLNLNNYFENQLQQRIQQDLDLFSSIPLVSHRMAIFQFLSLNADKLKLVDEVELIKSGLNDPHPWVVRTALSLAVDHQVDYHFNFKSYDRNLYPGVLDLLLKLIQLKKVDLNEVFEQNNTLTESDRQTLEEYHKIYC